MTDTMTVFGYVLNLDTKRQALTGNACWSYWDSTLEIMVLKNEDGLFRLRVHIGLSGDDRCDDFSSGWTDLSTAKSDVRTVMQHYYQRVLKILNATP